jgi:Flp pilus assembly protein TadG
VLRDYHGSDRAQGLVEFALVAPLLMMLLIGILDSAIAVNAFVTVSNASAEAARYGTAHPAEDTSTIRINAVVPHSQQLDTDPARLSLHASYGNPSQTWPTTGVPASSPSVRVPIQMTVKYDWGNASIFLGGLLSRLFGATTTFSATATAEVLR